MINECPNRRAHRTGEPANRRTGEECSRRFAVSPFRRFDSFPSGSIYVVVLGTSLLLTVIGLSALTLARVNARINGQAGDSVQAEVIAESGIEYMLSLIANDPNWRTTYQSGVATSERLFGSGGITLKLVDEADGNLANNNTDPVRVYSTGRVNRSVRVYSAVIGPVAQPYTCLNVPAVAGSSMSFGTDSITGTPTLASNGSFSATSTNFGGASIESVFAPTLLTCTNITSQKTGVTARQLPDILHVFDWYVANGQSISIGSIPTVGGIPTIDRQLICPANGTFGGWSSSNGIFVIDCQGMPITISDSRIVGTLVLQNCGLLTISGSGLFEPAVANYPTLLVQGPVALKLTNTQLQESTSPAVNFNPTGVPYPYLSGSGVANTTSTDSFQTVFNGILYSTGTITISNQPTIHGLLVANTSINSSSGGFYLTYDSSFSAQPPQGFGSTGQMMPLPGTWRWEKAP